MLVEQEAAKAEAAAKQAELDAKNAAKAEKKRLSACKRKGIDEADCPMPEMTAAADATLSVEEKLDAANNG